MDTLENGKNNTEKASSNHNNDQDAGSNSLSKNADAHKISIAKDNDELIKLTNHWPLMEDKDSGSFTQNVHLNTKSAVTNQPAGEKNYSEWNAYQHRKTLASGMMDLALLSANANQLKYILEIPLWGSLVFFSLIFISVSIILQVVVGILLIWNSRFNITKHTHVRHANRVNNYTLIGTFLITTCNVFITAFGVPAFTVPIAAGISHHQFKRDSNNTEYH